MSLFVVLSHYLIYFFVCNYFYLDCRVADTGTITCFDTGDAAITVPLTTTVVGDALCGVVKRATLPALPTLTSYCVFNKLDGNEIYLTNVPLTITPLVTGVDVL